jgi:hypothetical protein
MTDPDKPYYSKTNEKDRNLYKEDIKACAHSLETAARLKNGTSDPYTNSRQPAMRRAQDAA